MDDALQQEARALGDPTRHRIFRYVADAGRAVTISELTGHVSLNHNAVRQHLAALKDARLVVSELEDRVVPGRPRLLYRLHPEVLDRWGTTGSYSWLAGLLARAVRHKQDPRQVGRDEGRRQAAGLPGGDRTVQLTAEMERRGFRPTTTRSGSSTEFVLGRCPFADVARSDPGTVCRLHLGLAEGLAEGLDRLEVERLVAKDPQMAGCRLIVRQRGSGHDSSSG